MDFARPLGTLAFLALPLILWLHRSRRRAPERDVPSLQPWRILFAPAPRRRSVPPSVLLALRLAAAAAIALALLDPRPPGADLQTEAGGVVIALDTTTSMGASDRWPQALDLARSVFDATAGPAWIIALGPRPRIVVWRAPDPDAALAPLATIRPGGVGVRFDEAEILMRAALEGGAERAIVISDAGPSGAPALAEGVEWLHVGEAEDNVAVVGLRASQVDGATDVDARIANFGRRPVDVSVSLRLDEEDMSRREVSIDAGASREIHWRVGQVARRVSVSLLRPVGEADALADDDAAFAVVDGPEIPVQLIGRSPAIERALGALEGVSVESAGFGTLRTPGEGGVSVFVGRAPERPPEGGIIVIPQAIDASAGSPPPTLRLEGAGLHPLTRGLDLAGAMVEPAGTDVDAGLDTRSETVLAIGGTSVMRLSRLRPGGPRMLQLGFAPDRGNLEARAAFPLLVSRMIAFVAPQRPPSTLMAGAWAPLPPWPVQLTTPDDRLSVMGYGTDLTSRPGWYSVRSRDHEGPPIEFAVSAGDLMESDLSVVDTGEDTAETVARRAAPAEWWRVALLLGLVSILAEGAGRSSTGRPKDT